MRRAAKDKIEGYLTSCIRKAEQDVHIEYVCIEDDTDLGTADSLRLVAPKTKVCKTMFINSKLFLKIEKLKGRRVVISSNVN